MLHAVKSSKTRSHKRYTGERDGTEARVSSEDEITSTVFGPLDFMEPVEAQLFWRELLTMHGQGAFLPAGPPSAITMALWDRRKSVQDGSVIEPDLVVWLNWKQGESRILLIELKWRSPLSGNDQLRQQWECYLRDEGERQIALHVFIAHDVSQAAGEVQRRRDNGHARSMVLVPWLHVRTVLHQIRKQRTGIGRWAALADDFLERVQVLKFSGFQHLVMPELPAACEGSQLFWSKHRFSGWTEIVAASSCQVPGAGHVFFSSTD